MYDHDTGQYKQKSKHSVTHHTQCKYVLLTELASAKANPPPSKTITPQGSLCTAFSHVRIGV